MYSFFLISTVDKITPDYTKRAFRFTDVFNYFFRFLFSRRRELNNKEYYAKATSSNDYRMCFRRVLCPFRSCIRNSASRL